MHRRTLRDTPAVHRAYVRQHGEDLPEFRYWGRPYRMAAGAGD